MGRCSRAVLFGATLGLAVAFIQPSSGVFAQDAKTAAAPATQSSAVAQTVSARVLRAMLRVVSARPAFTAPRRNETSVAGETARRIPPPPPAIPEGKKFAQPLTQLPDPLEKKLVEQYPKGIESLKFDDFKKLTVASSKTIGVSLKSPETVTIGQVNKLLADNQVKLIGFQAFSGELFLLVPEVGTPEALVVLLDRLTKNSIVDFAFPILKYETTVLPTYNSGDWHWPWVLAEDAKDEFYESKQSGDLGTGEVPNLHLKGIRAPQSWVFADFCDRPWNVNKCPSYAKDFWTSFVLDSGFGDHPELPRYPKGRILVGSNSDPADQTHGTAVIGVMAAAHDGKGIEGVNPRGGIVFQSFLPSDVDQSMPHFYWMNTLRVANQSFASGMGNVLAVLQKKSKEEGGANAQEYNDTLNAYTRMANVSTRRTLKQVLLLTKSREAGGNPRPFYIVSATDNVSEISGLTPDLSSPYCGASETSYSGAYEDAAKRVICVGNYNPGSGSVISADYGTLNANGAYILTTVPYDRQPAGVSGYPRGYNYLNGASLAAPQVAAALDYMLLFAGPEISWDLKRLLWESARTVNDRKVLDLFAAFMRIDEENGKANPKWDRELQRYLADVNVAGNLDGNPRPGRSVKQRGDGQIDIRDFRAFRDALYQVATDDLDFPDKSAPHDPSKDLNGDGCVNGGGGKCDIKETVYPRYDLNGDGKLDAVARAKFKGKAWTDLDVLADFWPTEDDEFTDILELTNGYTKGNLVKLADPASGSGDIHVAAQFAPEFDELRLRFASAGWQVITRKLNTAQTELVHTVPANVPVGLTISAFKIKNNIDVTQKPVERTCTMSDKKPGVQRGMEQLVFYAEHQDAGKLKLPATLPALATIADENYRITFTKETTWGDCQKSGNGNGGGTVPTETEVQVGGGCINSAGFVCRRADDNQYYLYQTNPNPGPGQDNYFFAYNNLVDEPNPPGSTWPYCVAQYFCMDASDYGSAIPRNGSQLTCLEGTGCANPNMYTPAQ